MQINLNPQIVQQTAAMYLDYKTMLAAGAHNEDFYTLDSISHNQLQQDMEFLPGQEYQVSNVLFIPKFIWDKVKVSVDDFNTEMGKYPFYKGSKTTPMVYAIQVDPKDINIRRVQQIVEGAHHNVHDGVVNLWVILKVNGSYQSVFFGRQFTQAHRDWIIHG